MCVVNATVVFFDFYQFWGKLARGAKPKIDKNQRIITGPTVEGTSAGEGAPAKCNPAVETRLNRTWAQVRRLRVHGLPVSCD